MSERDEVHDRLATLSAAEAADQIRVVGRSPDQFDRTTPRAVLEQFEVWTARNADALPAVLVGMCPNQHAYLPGILLQMPSGRVGFIVDERTLLRIGASNGNPARQNPSELLQGTVRWTLPCTDCLYSPTLHWVKLTARAMHALMHPGTQVRAGHFALLD